MTARSNITDSNAIEQSAPHLNEEELNTFVNNPANADATALRLHIATCRDCSEKVSLLQDSQNIVKANADVISSLPSSDLKSRLHAATHELAMKAALSTSETKATSKTKKDSSLSSLFSSLFSFEVNWLTIPATAMASILAAWVFISPTNEAPTGAGNQVQLVSYQDSQGLIFQKQQLPQPGLGFFHQSDQTVQQYSGFDIKLNTDNNTVAIKWPKIDGVTQYQISLFEVANNVSKEISKTQTEGTLWQVEQSLLSPGMLYRLHLSGRTESELSFHYAGGFVFQ